MRNSSLKGFLKKSPIKQNESISDSTYRGNVKEVTITPPKKETYNPGKGSEKSKGTLVDVTKRDVDMMTRGNALATLFTGRKAKS